MNNVSVIVQVVLKWNESLLVNAKAVGQNVPPFHLREPQISFTRHDQSLPTSATEIL